MTPTEIPASEAARLIPLLRDVHDLHVAHHPHLYRAEPDPDALGTWLRDWLQHDTVHALALFNAEGVAIGYVIYEIEKRAASCLKTARVIGVLHHICVASEHRRQGLGLRLIEEVKARLRSEGILFLRTTYGAFNDVSAALMTKAGLTPSYIVAELALGRAGQA